MTLPQTQSPSVSNPPRTLRWEGDVHGKLILIDQTLLPGEFREIACTTVEQVWEAIKMLRVRGAPAIGCAAAYGVILGMQNSADADRPSFDKRFAEVSAYLAASRPTAVNLFWALDRLKRAVGGGVTGAPGHRGASCTSAEMLDRLLAEAKAIEEEDRAMCAAIGRHGASLLREGMGVLTHCNAGGLATAGDGTALAVIFAAAAEGKSLQVYADETRPLLQGARLTAWELKQRNVPVTVICDSMAGWVMKEGKVQVVITGADRIAANGDAANKIGTYSVALLARAHGIPFYVAAPSSTFDLSIETGADIPIEQRRSEEITNGFGRQTAPDGVAVYNPAFDVTPAEYIAALITENGVIRPVTKENIRSGLGTDRP